MGTLTTEQLSDAEPDKAVEEYMRDNKLRNGHCPEHTILVRPGSNANPLRENPILRLYDASR